MHIFFFAFCEELLDEQKLVHESAGIYYLAWLGVEKYQNKICFLWEKSVTVQGLAFLNVYEKALSKSLSTAFSS
jgi:hypothetical protein